MYLRVGYLIQGGHKVETHSTMANTITTSTNSCNYKRKNTFYQRRFFKKYKSDKTARPTRKGIWCGNYPSKVKVVSGRTITLEERPHGFGSIRINLIILGQFATAIRGRKFRSLFIHISTGLSSRNSNPVD